ncbi:MAG TPA: hypothetical protein VFX96_15585 [Pyrinomonadaceae bacterium]|nr:hypothetical protein [Pyrinomonadaceae bacterium]
MNSVKCARCGLINWVEDGECKRCGELLALLEEVKLDAAADGASDPAMSAPAGETSRVCSFCGTEFKGYFCTLCRKHAREAPLPGPEVERSFLAALLPSWKMKAAAALVLLLSIAGVLYAAGTFGGSRAGEFQAELIRQSDSFNAPVSFALAEQVEGHTGPAVPVLRELGLVRVRTAKPVGGTGESVVGQEDKVTETQLFWAEVTRVELTEEGRRESAGWKTFEPKLGARAKDAGARVWAVPVGEREFLEVKRVYPTTPGVYELSTVEFTWKWKPNALGRHFDVRSGEHAAMSDAARKNASMLGLDSEATREGKATLRYDGKRWAIEHVTFDEVAQFKAAEANQ